MTAAAAGRQVWLPFLAHGSNALLIGLAGAIAAGAPLFGFALNAPVILLGALLFWATEYGTHRFLFHARPVRRAWVRALQYRLHYDHHADPARLDLLFLPPWYVVPNLAVTTGLAWLVLGTPSRALSLDLGAILALLHYEWVHYIAHIPYLPRTAFGRWMKKYHLRHHFMNEAKWFGVSHPLGDMLAGTGGRPEATPRSSTTRILF